MLSLVAAALLPPAVLGFDLPDVKTFDGFSQVQNVAIPGNDTSTVKYLGVYNASEECVEACVGHPTRCWSFTYHTMDHNNPLTGQCFGLTSPSFSPSPENNTIMGVVEWPCRDDTDCSLNGVCDAGECECDPAWKGHRCEQLKLVLADRQSGYRGVDDGHNTSSWGGAVLKGPDGRYHMWASEMTEHCGIGAWAQNSRIIRAVSDTPGGAYKREQVVYEVFAHEPEVIRGSNGEYVMFFTASLRSEHGDCKCCRPGTPCDGSTGPGDCPGMGYNTNKTMLRDSDSSYMSYTTNPEGPWSEPQQIFPGYYGSDTNFAPIILPNGTLIALWRTWEEVRGSRIYLAIGDDWKNASTYKQLEVEIFPDLGPAGTEDPFVYIDGNGHFHAIFHHMYGMESSYNWWLLAEGGHAFSVDGVTWTYSGVAWGDPFDRLRGDVVHYKDGTSFRFTRRERPHFIIDEKGRPTHLVTAAQYGTGKNPGGGANNDDACYTLIQQLGG
ncbi:hypothetical protein AAMO2058_000006500 [Amorphochlora amoebiformis]